jgi:hypothetical protein
LLIEQERGDAVPMHQDRTLAERLRWEIVSWLQDLRGERSPAQVLAAEQGISRPLIDAALRYQAAYPEEVEVRIALHRHESAAADAR